MSVIAWDGTHIAADKQSTVSDIRMTTTKMRRLKSGEIAAWTGSQECGLILARWYEEGADSHRWPEFQKDKENWTRLIIVSSEGAFFFEMQPVAQVVEDQFMAWGSGRDFAMGALAQGATAKEAVAIANRLCTTCGLGIDVYDTTRHHQ